MPDNKPRMTAAEMTERAYHFFLDAKGLSPRAGQVDMMAFCSAVVNATPAEEQYRVGVIEAGTGTGKTLGYCLPLIPLAMEKHKTLIISTATVALQEQIISKDLPEIQARAGLSFSYAMAKGRSRYFCQMRCDVHMESEMNAYGYIRDDVEDISKAFAGGHWTGERDSYPDEINEAVWGRVNAIGSQCPKKRCPHYHRCPFFLARALLESVDVVIANHDIVLSDLSLGGGIILPPQEESIYVFDEGHHVPQKAINHFATSASLDASRHFMSEIFDMVMTMPESYGGTMEKHVQQLVELAGHAGDELGELRGTLLRSLNWRNDHEMPNGTESDIYRFPEGFVPEDIAALFKPGLKTVNEMQNIVVKMTAIVDEAGRDISEEELALQKMAVGELANRLAGMHQALASYCGNKTVSGMPMARWINVRRTKRSTEVVINCSPVYAGEHLKSELWSKAYATIVTSATIRSLSKFDAFLEQAGLPVDTPTLLARSPFDYQNNGVLFIPRMRSVPTNHEEHTAEIIELLPKLVLRLQGCLVLFASRRQMEEVSKAMPQHISPLLLIQGALPKREILLRHKLRIDRGEPSIIFGMASFSEGVDLPGVYCNNVIIAKLPFSVPTDPGGQTLTEWLEKNGRDAFREISIPEACLKLTQSVGRLIRTESDTGAVTILDKRLKTKAYGKDILASLPPFRREIR